MKNIITLSVGFLLVLFITSCTKNFDEINDNPNLPEKVTTPSLLTAAQKGLCDDIYDEWWGGRQSMLYAQYWVQRNYPSEDRFAIRQSVNNQYFRRIYHDVMNLMEIIKLNTNADTKAAAAIYGDNNNQIAVATILKVW
ncbi:MAG TPA: SusD/RagB family nutrient-binding outer membrane lipoprotein, partial [Candidatus Cloacimonadota bacterium]|nr:SusD/RagB family nutrient-binding outer membrane lipoprotein [Candidatus Cloacimonadota bacterium]